MFSGGTSNSLSKLRSPVASIYWSEDTRNCQVFEFPRVVQIQAEKAVPRGRVVLTFTSLGPSFPLPNSPSKLPKMMFSKLKPHQSKWMLNVL